jgi:hypothetical protein
MVLVLVIVPLGIAAGYLGGGRLRRLAEVRFERLWLVGLAFGAQLLLNVLVAAGLELGAGGTLLLLVSQSALVGFVWSNRLLAGMTLITVGFLLNALVITANGAMPVSRDAIAAVSSDPIEIAVGKHRVLEADDPLPWLADVIPLPPLRTIVSLGDVVLAVGAGLLVANLMTRPARARARSETSDEGGTPP